MTDDQTKYFTDDQIKYLTDGGRFTTIENHPMTIGSICMGLKHAGLDIERITDEAFFHMAGLVWVVKRIYHTKGGGSIEYASAIDCKSVDELIAAVKEMDKNDD